MTLDTTRAAAQERLKALRRLTAEDRLAQALELSEAVRQLAAQGERDRAEAA